MQTAATHLDFAALKERVVAKFPAIVAAESDNKQPYLVIPAARLLEVAEFLKTEPELHFDSLLCLSGVDLLKYAGTRVGSNAADDLVCVYHLHSLTHFHALTLKVFLPRTVPGVASVSKLWAVANYFEREIFDLYGVNFAGHPNLKRIMTPEDWVGHPLRKDYVYPENYNQVELRREGQHFDAGPYADKSGEA